MAEKIAFDNGKIFNFERLVTLTLTLHKVILHTIVHQLSTFTCMLFFWKLKKLFVDERTDGQELT